MKTQAPLPSASASAPSLESLLQQKRREQPTAAYWTQKFEPRFTRKLMGAVANPPQRGRTLTIVGWSGPLVFLGALGIAVGVAYLFSPARAIARWESAASSRQYVVDTLDSSASDRPYSVDHGLGAYSFSAGLSDGITDLTPAAQSKSQF